MHLQYYKNTLTAAKVLTYPTDKELLILDTEGIVLSQTQDPKQNSIGYFSKTMEKTKWNYYVIRKELTMWNIFIRSYVVENFCKELITVFCDNIQF